MKKRNVCNSLQIKIRRYLEYKHELENLGANRGENLLRNLSFDLFNKLKIKSYGKLLKKLIFFKNKEFSKNLLKKLSLKIKEKNLAQEEILNMVFFLICVNIINLLE